MPDHSELAKRIKLNYENPARHYLTRRIPVIIRVDGRAFSTFTRQCNSPFDHGIMRSMVMAARALADDMQGCKLAYIQSDEASFVLTDYDTLTTDAWFGYNQSKVESVSASVFGGHFNKMLNAFGFYSRSPAAFDARAFNIPEQEVVNYFLWRATDWQRNSLSLYTRQFFSHCDLQGKNRTAMHEMLAGIGQCWTKDLSYEEKNGTFIVKSHIADVPWRMLSNIEPHYNDIKELWESANELCDLSETTTG